MTLQTHCKPRASVFAADRRATVLSLDTFLKGQVDGADFFRENYFTTGMETLVDRSFRHLSGTGAGSSVFLLSQAMGGGKTHSMIALGLLAKDPELRKSVLGDKNPAPKLGRCRVAGFNGRSTDAAGGIWGSIAEQLGKAQLFASYVSPLLSAPGPEAWKQLLGGDPLVLFLDELPPYLEYAVAVPVGNADLSVVTTAALANLFVAVADMDNVCLVLSDLAGTNFSVGQSSLQAAFSRAIQGISSESRRIAVPITPVNPNGDELYHILRKRLFETVAPDPEVQRIAENYREALREAQKMGLTTTTPESLYTRIIDSYLKIEPLHAPTVVYETGSAEPTRASTPVPTPTRFEATGLRYRFLAVDPDDLARSSPIKDWTAKLRLKYQIHDRGDHYEIELLALPKANGIVIHYTTDGSAPTNAGRATYDGKFRVRSRPGQSRPRSANAPRSNSLMSWRP